MSVSGQKTELTVFVASPGDVVDERDAVVDIAARLNATLGDLLNVMITIKRYEYIAGRAGAPQKQIDPWVDDCDVFIAILHRRWGSPPDDEFDSGFAEEFDRALRRWQGQKTPSISIYFKLVDQASVQDPGPQLKSVLEFRRSVEAQRLAFYSEFESTSDFALLVQRMLIEEMHKVGRIGVNGGGYLPTQAGAEREEQVAKDRSNDTGIASMFSNFAAALSGRQTDGSLDFDRLELFALSASRDDEDIPTHLANRLFGREDSPQLSKLEAEAWFATYVGDVGRSQFASERVIPFPAKFGGVPTISSIATELATELLVGGSTNQRVGILRVLRVTNLRPRDLWPTGSLSESDLSTLVRAWSKIKESRAISAAVEYWMTVATSRDLRLARVLANSAEEDPAALGRILMQLLPKQPTAELLAQAEPALLLRTWIAEKFEENNPFRTVTTETLATTLGRRFLNSTIRAACLKELASRGEVPDSAIVEAVNEKGHEGLLEDAWPVIARAILFDAPISVSMLTQIAGILGELEDKSVARLVLARIAASNPQFREVAAEALGKTNSNFREPDAVAAELTMAAESHGLELAAKLMNQTYPPATQYLGMLKDAGANDVTLAYVADRYIYIGVRYLAAHAEGATKSSVQRRLRKDRAEGALRRHQSTELLAHCFGPTDVEYLLENLRYSSSDRKETIARFLRQGTLKTLTNLIESTISDVPALALRELESRQRLPSRSSLMNLLGSEDADLRMVALDILASESGENGLEDLLHSYMNMKGTTYYNVVCELDHQLSKLPAYYPLVAP